MNARARTTSRFDAPTSPVVWAAAVVVPGAIAAAFIPVREHITDVNVALVEVLAVVGIAAFGHRAAGIIAALTAGLAFDFVWTTPFYSLQMSDPGQVQTVVLLVVVGAAVSEISHLAQRARTRAGRSRGYVQGVIDLTASGSDPAVATDRATTVLTQLLGVDRVGFLPASAGAVGGAATIGSDGRISRGDRVWDVERNGLPTDAVTVLPVRSGASTLGQLEIVAAGSWSRPTREQLQVAVLVADRLGQALSSTGASWASRGTPGHCG